MPDGGGGVWLERKLFPSCPGCRAVAEAEPSTVPLAVLVPLWAQVQPASRLDPSVGFSVSEQAVQIWGPLSV